MKELILRDDRELRRIETAIAAMERAPASERLRRHCLLAALEAERDELLRVLGRSHGPRRNATAQARQAA
jgi:hypothetical protein